MNSYKNRTLDLSKLVKVYFHFRRKMWSLEQDGFVIGHTKNIVLKNAQFYVNENGRQKVLETKQKNVHAKVIGFVESFDNSIDISNLNEFYYNPYKTQKFSDKNDNFYIESSNIVALLDNKTYYLRDNK